MIEVLLADSVEFGCHDDGIFSEKTLSLMNFLLDNSFFVDVRKISGSHDFLRVAKDYDAIVIWDYDDWEVDIRFLKEKYPKMRVIVISDNPKEVDKATSLDILMVDQRRSSVIVDYVIRELV